MKEKHDGQRGVILFPSPKSGDGLKKLLICVAVVIVPGSLIGLGAYYAVRKYRGRNKVQHERNCDSESVE